MSSAQELVHKVFYERGFLARLRADTKGTLKAEGIVSPRAVKKIESLLSKYDDEAISELKGVLNYKELKGPN